MDTGLKYGLMVQGTQVNGNLASPMDLEYSITLMEILLKDNSKMTKQMEKEYTDIS